MDRFNALGRGAQLMLVAGVLLLIDLFLPWQDFDVGGLADEFGVDATFSGWRGFAGVMLGLLTILAVAWIVVRLASVKIPLPISPAMTSALLGGLVLVFGIIKFLSVLGDEQTIWAFIGLILAVVVGVGAWLEVQAAGGLDTLKSEIPATSSSAAPAAPSPPEAAPPPQPAEPTEPTPPAEPEAPYDPDERREP
jgi:hypothetical protein